MQTFPVTPGDYPALLQVWEDAVRATHDFLPEANLQALKPLLLSDYFDAVTLRCVKDKAGAIVGFVGVAQGNIEMLFVAPEHFGQGLGKTLLTYAREHLAASTVDVNEQNPKALGFYLCQGFVQTGRSPLDGQGNPFPLIHMTWPEPA
ncbi:GNAT family N-acetyltransferase [Aestuariibacter halophilus]|uniref:GNAT family N-acetyltransferase n=1 Tax=Fluctibacter halophilus TaxID=226011 RepID=A0ABS8GBC3_9ALTE|nr:GNAT family N-acetyltransferase [Aestuariibacter halophilus]MCC2617798.1 GNAT family N-acetyltransferase [Aestuariibacter halophilus]